MDKNYAFYLYVEDLKNSLYRQLSGARQYMLFWPKLYYSWFYVDEKILYKCLCLRENLGLDISNKEIELYNKVRSQIAPYFPFIFRRKEVKRKLSDGTHVKYADITWERKNHKRLAVISFLFGLVTTFGFQRSRYWLLWSFAPYAMLLYMDHRYAPYSEIENFYKYVHERRKAVEFMKDNQDTVERALQQVDQDAYSKIQKELHRTRRTMWEVLRDIDKMYLDTAKECHTI